MRINHHHRITHPALTPFANIEGQVQYPQVLVRLVSTRKPVNQYLLSPQLTGMGALALAHRPLAKVGHLSHDLTHLPRHGLSFPHHPTATLLGPTPTNASATTQGTSLKRPQKLPRSPLNSVRNVVTAWKSRSPSADKSSQVSATDTTPERRYFSAYGAGLRGVSSEKELQ